MRYFGGKTRIAKKLWQHMQPFVTDVYVEPFIGGGASMCVAHAKHRIANDANFALISMFKALQRGWQAPLQLSEYEYAELSKVRDPENPLTAFAGFGCSFAGKWFGGYARDSRGGNYALQTANSLQAKKEYLKGVTFIAGDYLDLRIPKDAVVYCDPPYKGTTAYGATAPFNWDTFWAWARDISRYATVFVSEYSAPDDITLYAELNTKTEIRTNLNGREDRIEKLYILSVDRKKATDMGTAVAEKKGSKAGTYHWIRCSKAGTYHWIRCSREERERG